MSFAFDAQAVQSGALPSCPVTSSITSNYTCSNSRKLHEEPLNWAQATRRRTV